MKTAYLFKDRTQHLQQSILLLELPYFLGFYFFQQRDVIISRKFQRAYFFENLTDNGDRKALANYLNQDRPAVRETEVL